MKIKMYLTVVAVGIAAFSFGRFLGPKKVEIKEVERVVYRERTEKDKTKTVSEKKKETTLPDGTKIVETERKEDSESRTKKDAALHHDKFLERKTDNRTDWRVGVIYTPQLSFQTNRYGFILERRIIGEVYVGVMIQTDKTAGASLSLGF